MIKTILEKLSELGIKKWEISEETTKAWEFYFIKHALDQHRIKDVIHTTVHVYVTNEDGTMGDASAEIPPFSKAEEIYNFLKNLQESASYIHNQAYSLVGKNVIQDNSAKVDIAKVAHDFIEAVHSVKEDKCSYVNSYEIFVNEKTVHLLNSNGLDVMSVYPSSMLEIILNARQDQHEIELYRSYKMGTCDCEFMQNEIQKALKYGLDRLSAIPTPFSGEMPVLFANSDVVKLFDYYKFKLNAQALVMQASNWHKGDLVAHDVKGDKVSVKALNYLANSSQNCAFDGDGAKIKEIYLIENNVVKHAIGNRRFAAYANLDDAFMPKNYIVSGGSYKEEELRKGDYLEVVDFSDFQMDDLKGDFAGEIRLAYLHKDGKVMPVTGGSISDNWSNQIQNLKMTKELKQYDTMVVPQAVLLPKVMITGVKHD